jgi:endonuclease-3
MSTDRESISPEIIERARQVHERLLEAFGMPDWGERLSPLEELVSTILSQNTNDRNRDLAFNSLRQRFDRWEDVRDAPEQAVMYAIRPAGLANQKGPRIQEVLRQITEERGELDLEFLRELPTEEARQWLLKFKGVGPKTAAIVLQFSLGKPAFPVDTHVYRVTGRLGLRPDGMTADQAHEYFERVFSPDVYGPAHINIILLGRRICAARNPMHAVCPVKDLCDYYQNLVDPMNPVE